MSDVTVAAAQDEIAESLLGTPEPQTQEATPETTGTEQPTEETIQAEGEQPQTEETADDWLPNEQEKVFPDDVINRYAERYGLDEQKLSDPLIRQLLHDKLNSDILIRQQMAQPEIEIEPQAQAKPEPTQAQPQITQEQHLANLQRLVESRTDPAIAKAFHTEFLKAFGVPDNEIAALPPQQAMAFTATASKFMLNLVNTFLPDMLQATMQPILEQNFPGFRTMHAESSRSMAWDTVRNSSPEFADLPAYGTKEFKAIADKVAEQYPALTDLVAQLREQGRFVGKDAEKIYISVARLAKSQPADPALLRQAVAAGAKNARRANVNRQAGNLGSGQSKSASGAQGASSKFQTNQDIFDAETMENWTREHGRL